jgi:hypothetical protein
MEFAYHYCFDCIYWSMFWLVFLSVSPPSPGRIVDNIFGHYWLKCWNCRTAMVWLVDFSLTVVLIGGFFTHCCLDWWVFHSLLSWLVDFSLTVVLIGVVVDHFYFYLWNIWSLLFFFFFFFFLFFVCFLLLLNWRWLLSQFIELSIITVWIVGLWVIRVTIGGIL